MSYEIIIGGADVTSGGADLFISGADVTSCGVDLVIGGADITSGGGTDHRGIRHRVLTNVY